MALHMAEHDPCNGFRDTALFGANDVLASFSSRSCAPPSRQGRRFFVLPTFIESIVTLVNRYVEHP